MNELEDILRKIESDMGVISLKIMSLEKQLEAEKERLHFLNGQSNAVQQLKPQITSMIAKAVEESRQEPE